MVFMSKPVASGEKKTCPVCKEKGFTVEINAVESEYQGNKRLSWKNADGTAHIKKQDDGSWMHIQSTTTPEQASRTIQTVSPELEELIQGCEKQLKESGMVDAFAVEYMAARNILLPYIPEGATQGVVCGNMFTNYFHMKDTPLPIEFVKATKLAAERKQPQTFIHNGLVETPTPPHNGLVEAPSGNFPAQAKVAQKVEDNVRWIRLNSPNFSDTMSANDKVKIYLERVYDIILPHLPIPLETITREFRHQSEYKKTDLEQEKREEYMKKQFATGGTIDKGLLLD